MSQVVAVLLSHGAAARHLVRYIIDEKNAHRPAVVSGCDRLEPFLHNQPPRQQLVPTQEPFLHNQPPRQQLRSAFPKPIPIRGVREEELSTLDSGAIEHQRNWMAGQ